MNDSKKEPNYSDPKVIDKLVKKIEESPSISTLVHRHRYGIFGANRLYIEAKKKMGRREDHP